MSPIRRSLLFVPASAEARVQKASSLNADAVVLDLEDGVAASAKESARRFLVERLPDLEFGDTERIVRVNRVGSADHFKDIAALPYGSFEGLLIPKVESPAQVLEVAAVLDEREAKAGLKRGTIRLLLTLETPRGMLNALAIADASDRCSALFFGAGDYSVATGCSLTPQALAWPRATIVAAAAAAGCEAIDTPYFDVRDADGTYNDALLSRDHGFGGKGVFHPLQIEPVHRALSPTAKQVEKAHRVLAAFSEMGARGEGIAIVDGELIAIDLLPQMERVIRRDAQAKRMRMRADLSIPSTKETAP
ncbi:CoA ester lyase [Hydrogenophaga sp.]|uniref:HpcH/HpaI aldolase/citrate lyase family protein n=1 Tax=Hydrogenophaga sp. TaxID=1904254 RepID=UPI002728A69F|nr:CoA ester lyase [Hydrogenophaga sp.]MDO9435371.1 CoA ester lyase [Hydrogenophaga sp.]